jgi:hypothetical protein
MKKTKTEELLFKQIEETNLCWKGCKHFKQNEKENCPIAQHTIEFNKSYGIITPIWKCETFEKGD